MRRALLASAADVASSAVALAITACLVGGAMVLWVGGVAVVFVALWVTEQPRQTTWPHEEVWA